MESSRPDAPESTFDDGDLYDVLFGNFDYGLDFYMGLAREAKGPVLDIACGTGRVMLPALQAGLDVEGLDLYDGMLDRLRTKAAGLGLQPVLHRARLSVHPPAFNKDNEVELVEGLGSLQGQLHQHAVDFGKEVGFEGLVIDYEIS